MADSSALLKSTCARTPMVAIRRDRWVIWRAGTSPRRFGTAVLAADFFLPQKIGPEATGASKWRRIHGWTTNSRKPATKPWALRSLTGACTIVSRFSFGLQIGTDKSASRLLPAASALPTLAQIRGLRVFRQLDRAVRALGGH